jgi:enamine deaminase RidA (YjgF/YER057c/UK114 family)
LIEVVVTVKPKTFGFGMPWESLYGYSQALQAGETLYISGQLSHDLTGRFVGAGVSDLALPDQLVEIGAVVRLDLQA